MPKASLVWVGALSGSQRNRHGIELKQQGKFGKRRPVVLDIGRCSALEQVELEIVRDQAVSPGGSSAERVRKSNPSPV